MPEVSSTGTAMVEADEGRSDASGEPERAEVQAETTLESFVTALQQEGVEAGRREAERLTRAAEARAGELVEKAEAEASRIEAEAKSRARAELLRGQTELRLAARDAVLELKDTLQAILASLLEGAVERRLEDPAFLGELVREVVEAYARSDAGLDVRVPEASAERLREWALAELSASLKVEGSETMRQAGFEYLVGEGTVEVTTESVVEKLLALVTPRLREVVQEAVEESDAETASVGSGGEGSSSG